MNTDPNLAAITVIDERPTKKPAPKPPKKPLSATQAGKPNNRNRKGGRDDGEPRVPPQRPN